MKKRSKRLDVFKTMPPLRHTVGCEYSHETSEVIAWMVAQPELLHYLLSLAKCGSKPLIIYNPATGTWQGRDYRPDAKPRKWVF